MMNKDDIQVVILGDANVDMLVKLPNPDASLGTEQKHVPPELHGGGTAANVAVALARLGVPVSFVGAVGADNYGRWVHEDLLKEGVENSGLQFIEDAFTVMVMAIIEPSGERLIYVWPPSGGAHEHVTKNDVTLSEWPSAKWLHTTGICLRGEPIQDTVLDTMAKAKQLGWKVSLDLNLRSESWGLDQDTRKTFKQAIELSDVVFGNAEEEILPISGKNNLEEALRIMCDKKRVIVARQGEQGATICTPVDFFHSPAVPVKVVDTLGAGDVFNAGYIYAKLFGASDVEAARSGNTVAAKKIEHPGARGLPKQNVLPFDIPK